MISLENGISAFSKLKKKQKKIISNNSHKLKAGDRSGRISLLSVF
jgi:hypothetical protein